MNKPTFEDLVGTESVEEWTNDVSDGELNIVSLSQETTSTS